MKLSGGANVTNTSQIASGVIVDDDINAAAAIALSKLASDPLARANHTGTQTKSTVSDYPAAASQAEAEAGTVTTAREFTPERVKQAIVALGAPATTARTLIPRPNFGTDPAGALGGLGIDLSVATVQHLGQIVIPFKITPVTLSLRTGVMAGAMTIDINLYSEDGQTNTVLVANGSIADTDDNVVKSFTIAPGAIQPGIYYLGVNIIDASGGILFFWETAGADPFDITAGLTGDVATKPVLQGTVAISSGVPATTITPGSITDAVDQCLIIRLDA